MEARCDAAVTEKMSKSERLYYIKTIIDLSGVSKKQYALGMGKRRPGFKAMEKRVRSIY